MESPDLGPEWFWKLLFFLGAVGLISAIVWAVKGIIWAFNHVTIQP